MVMVQRTEPPSTDFSEARTMILRVFRTKKPISTHNSVFPASSGLPSKSVSCTASSHVTRTGVRGDAFGGFRRVFFGFEGSIVLIKGLLYPIGLNAQ